MEILMFDHFFRLWQSLHMLVFHAFPISIGCLYSTPPNDTCAGCPSNSWANNVWQILQSFESIFPSLLTCLPSWQRKHPGEYICPICSGKYLQLTFISGK